MDETSTTSFFKDGIPLFCYKHIQQPYGNAKVSLTINMLNPNIYPALAACEFPGIDKSEIVDSLGLKTKKVTVSGDNLKSYWVIPDKEEFDFINGFLYNGYRHEPKEYPVLLGIEQYERYGYPELSGLTVEEGIGFYQMKIDQLKDLQESIKNTQAEVSNG